MLSSHPRGHVDGTVVLAAGWVTHDVQPAAPATLRSKITEGCSRLPCPGSNCGQVVLSRGGTRTRQGSWPSRPARYLDHFPVTTSVGDAGVSGDTPFRASSGKFPLTSSVLGLCTGEVPRVPWPGMASQPSVSRTPQTPGASAHSPLICFHFSTLIKMLII